ncbi:NUDIX domain-containing protein [Candidatus Parcubacteria bacterium]|nr:NUDIX domain-containing protein [Candidatus Parcubacteria bacterium]
MNNKEEKILNTIKEFYKKLPKFPDGRIDYSNADIAPVITVFVKYKDKILLLKRSDKVRTYQGKWNTVAGYLDELKPMREKALEEIQEELKINKNNILSFHIGETYRFKDNKVNKNLAFGKNFVSRFARNKTWIVHPVLVELKKLPRIKLDWEHTEYKWIKPKELKKFDIVTNLEKSFKKVA